MESGFKAMELEYRAGREWRGTKWALDGTVVLQMYRDAQGNKRLKMKPPWLWGVTDQTEPSMPEWMKDDEKWAKALEEAR